MLGACHHDKEWQEHNRETQLFWFGKLSQLQQLDKTTFKLFTNTICQRRIAAALAANSEQISAASVASKIPI